MAVSSANAAAACLPPACQLSWAMLSAVQRHANIAPLRISKSQCPSPARGYESPSIFSVGCGASHGSCPSTPTATAAQLLPTLELPGSAVSPPSPAAQFESHHAIHHSFSAPIPIPTVTSGGSVSSAVRSYARGFTNVDRNEQCAGGLSPIPPDVPRHARRLSSGAVFSGHPPRAPKPDITEQFASIKPRSNMRGRSHSMADLTGATIPDNVRVSPARSPMSQGGVLSVAMYVERGSSPHPEKSFYASQVAGIMSAARSCSHTEPTISLASCGRRPPSPNLAAEFKAFACARGGSRREFSMG